MKNLQYERGEALLQLQRAGEAEQAFAAETAAFPENLKAWGSLAVVRAAKGDPAAARGTIEEMLRRNPGPEAERVAADVRATLPRG